MVEEIKFGTVYQLVKSEMGNEREPSLAEYCSCLHEMVEPGERDIKWIFSNDEDIDGKILAWFKTGEMTTRKEAFIGDLVKNLSAKYRLVGYFKPYLQKELDEHLGDMTGEVSVKVGEYDSLVSRVQNYIKERVLTCFALGSYDSGSGEYTEDVSKYMYRNRISLDRSQVQEIMSVQKVLDEVVSSVKSMPLFSYGTYQELISHWDQNLFKVSRNLKFLETSGLVDSEGNARVDDGN